MLYEIYLPNVTCSLNVLSLAITYWQETHWFLKFIYLTSGRLDKFYIIIYTFLFYANRIEPSKVQPPKNSMIFENYPSCLRRAE